MKRAAQLLTAIALLAGCGAERPTATETTADVQPLASRTSVERDLATLRRVTAPFRDFAAARRAGWAAQITPCMTNPPAGGMGFHYGNPAVIDGAVRVEEPELLLYEPQEDGRMRLVAVEYIIPYAIRSRDAEPPVLFGETFLRNDTFQLWGLHVWVWKANPSGVFASWNPTVTCAHADDAAVMAHD